MSSFEHIIAHFRDGSQLPIDQTCLGQYGRNDNFYIATSLLDRSKSLQYWSHLADLHGYNVKHGRSQFQYGHPLFLGYSLQDDLKNAARCVLQHCYSTTLSSMDSIHSCLKQKTPALGHTQLFHPSHIEQLFSLIQAGMVIPFVYDSILSTDSTHAIVPKLIEMQSHIGYLPRAKDMLRCMTKNESDDKRANTIGCILDQTRKLGSLTSTTKPILVIDNNPVNGRTSMDEIGMHRTLNNDMTFPGSLYDIYRDAGELYIDIFDYNGNCTDRHLRLRDYSIVCRMLYDDIKQVESAMGTTVAIGPRKVVCDPKACEYLIQLLTDPEQSFLWHMAWSYLIDKSDMPILKELTGTQHHSLDMYELHRLDRPYTIAPGHYYCKPSTGIAGRGGFFVDIKQALSSTAFVARHRQQLGPDFVSDRYILQTCLTPYQLQTPTYLADESTTTFPSICELRTIIFPGLGSLETYQPIRFARHFPLFRYRDHLTTQPSIDSYCPTNMGNGLQELWQYMDHAIINPDYRLSPFGRCPVVTTYH